MFVTPEPRLPIAPLALAVSSHLDSPCLLVEALITNSQQCRSIFRQAKHAASSGWLFTQPRRACSRTPSVQQEPACSRLPRKGFHKCQGRLHSLLDLPLLKRGSKVGVPRQAAATHSSLKYTLNCTRCNVGYNLCHRHF